MNEQWLIMNMHRDASSRCIIMLMMHRDDDEQPLHMLKSMCSG
jgi:hypothetical protein